MGLVTATTMGSGKSYLTYLFEELYGMGTLPWPATTPTSCARRSRRS
ncbi:hypothetical protein ID875_32690 [Streptomyces globisporus]|uniref:Uncharacterized protein n=1 Tax=Streptomyces globisporus TaxID=1908 RepID=A0A927BPY7_STRGL|nr:hypothetical protein [Streptomyces globisporus]